MKGILERIKREPAVVLTLLAALFGVAAAFGLDLSKEQTGAITALVTVIVGLVVRQQVVPARAVAAYETIKGEVVTGQAAPPEDEPAAVVTSDDGTGLNPDEHGEAEVGLALVVGTFFLLAVFGILAVSLVH